ncbi:Mediator complex, subunit Med12 [Penicillium griseofulvum]|uniref:Mediator of RNA polymerase II transcription subunit 12 n=1 Tax=Penicillium patulum TaxID=5078 RepID=A0A135L9Z7_PENPA|nr:Mediator complex, subunit Med12 [Penicillium griseofulvum]KXG45781.1 Mediator complex, subunit Med12 [Penicillium griseofulvum]
MIPHSSAGGQPWGHPLRTFNGPGRVDNAQMGQYDNPDRPASLQPIRQPVVVDLTAESHDREPPPKRPRLDVPSGSNTDTGAAVGETRSTPGSAISRPAVSWRGRPVWSFQAVVSELPSNENRGDGAAGSKPPSPPPLPAQPWKNNFVAEPEGSGVVKSRESSPVGAVQTTPYRIEIPSVAPLYKGQKPADFAPWTGNHQEDVLSEQTAKQGYYDRTQVSQNESNTARPALYAQLKNRTGLQMLSSVFAAALEKRQTQNTIHAPSTFKPPPRVTLTDNKREAWLRDLANPSVPLRRLSRTIPHGIRGKILLDQCLGKWIPVARAVWLAKCVGANEIRAFKRKGTSGALAVGLEAKWVRDWTTNVQQFVEGVFAAPKSSDWKAKMTYAVGLTARLFSENLLDHDHFLEWFLSSFEAASIGTIPIWILMLGIYWNSIMRYRRRGRRLAELLLQKVRQATEAKLTQLQPLIDRLSRFIKKLVLDHTSSMILPNSWEMYKHQVSSALDLGNEAEKALFQSLAERNARVQRPKHSKQTTHRSPHQGIVRLLDSIRSSQDLSSIFGYLDAFDDKAILVFKLLEWLSTPFRHGLCRVYIGVRLLRKWKLAGVDIDSHILAFLSRGQNNQKLNMDQIYHVVSELVRSQTFSVGRYLQWLMARGVTNGSSSAEGGKMKDLPIDIGLIAQLPVARLPEHVGNLRSTLLARTGLSASEENAAIDSVKDVISQRLPGIFGVNESASMALDSLPSNLPWAVKAEVGQWLRRAIAEHNRSAESTNRAALPVGIASVVSALTPAEFYIVRDALESFGDISMLADVLKFASTCGDSTVLASVADTTNCHFDSLCVIGATTDLFRRLIDAYAGIKRLGMPNLDLIFSLIELGLRIPSELNTVSILRQDLSRMENKSIVAASSPVSDHIPEGFGGVDPFFREKLDQLLQSGNVMDEPTLDAVFNTLIKHLESDNGHANLSANDTCRYLAQLRSFHPKHFDGILARWVCSHLRSPERTILLRILPPLIGVGCVTIRAFLALAKRLTISTPATVPNAAQLPADLVQLLVSGDEDSKSFDLVSYRFQLAQQEFLNKNSEEALKIVCDAASSKTDDSSIGHSKLEHSIVMLLRDLLVRHPECAAQNGIQKLIDQYPASLSIVQKALDLLLGVESQYNGHSVLSKVEKLACMTDDFSLPFCQLKLQVLFHADSGSEDRTNIVDAMFKTAVSDCRAHRLHWVELVALMSPDAVRQIRERAEKEFFSIPLLEEPIGEIPGSPDKLGSLETAKMYLTIIEELASSIPDSGAPSVAPVLVEKMDSLLHKIITMHSSAPAKGMTNTSRANFERALAFWFSALLRMIVLHRSAFAQPPAALKTNPLHEQLRLLTSIFCIALSRLPGDVLRLFPAADYFPHPAPAEGFRPCPGILLQTHALDVAASLIDVFPEEVRQQCARFLKEKCPSFVPFMNDSRFLYLLGPMIDQYSANAQQVSAPSPAASGSTPTQSPALFSIVGSSTAQQSVPAASGLSTGLPDSNCMANRLRLQHRGRVVGPYPVRPWELLEDAAPFLGVNDTAVNLGFFDARRVRA